MKLLEEMWNFADAAYYKPQNKEEFQHIVDGNTLEKFTQTSNNTHYGFIAEYPNKSIISFRGTSNLKGWLADLDVYPLQEAKTIHHGFYDGWVFFKPMVDTFLRTYDNRPLFVTGHSLGAALGVLCARHMAKNRNISGFSCIVKGCPRIGNKIFRDQYNKLPIDTTRLENGYDIVTRVPPRSAGFRHVGKSCWFPKPFYHRWFWSIRNHLMPDYHKAILKGVHKNR